MIESEIQFLLGLVLNHKLTSEVKKICLERIGRIEESLRAPRPLMTSGYGAIAAPVVQAPSTQRLLDGAQQAHVESIPNSVHGNVLMPTPKETVTFQSPNGSSTRGPSKVSR